VTDARDSARRPPTASPALLSIGHIATHSDQERAEAMEMVEARLRLLALTVEDGRPSPPKPMQIWVDGSRVDVPRGMPPLDVYETAPRLPNGRRGAVTEFSDKSRRRLQRELATRRRDAEAYTMALTLPGDFSHLPAEVVMSHFRKLHRRFVRKWSGKHVSIDWKREPQKRLALHYHLLLYGLEDSELRESVRHWFVSQWNALCCEGLDATAREEHRWFHARDENFEKVRAFARYFAKYFGKADDASVAYPGRWWGSWNKAALPISQKLMVSLPPAAVNSLRRIARRLMRDRANETKHRAIVTKLGIRQISRWELQCFRMGYTRQGFRPQSCMIGPDQWRLSGQEIAACFDQGAAAHGMRFGKFKPKPGKKEKRELRRFSEEERKAKEISESDPFRSSFILESVRAARKAKAISKSNAPLSLLGELSPSSMLRAVEWVSSTLGISLQPQDETTYQSSKVSPLIPPPGYVRRPRKPHVDVQFDLIPVERVRPSALGFNQIADGGKGCPSRGRIGGRLSRLPG